MFQARTVVSNLVSVMAASGITLMGCAGEGHDPFGSGEGVSTESSALRVPTPSDPKLVVPEGNRLAFALDAVGVQIYQCQGDAASSSWVFQAPEAALYSCPSHSAGTHYAGPTWEANDGSKVVASKVDGHSPDPEHSIAELLLKATTHTGAGRMEKVSYIQRLETSGGLAPKTGCDADHLGAIARVDYTAVYYFYEPKRGRR